MARKKKTETERLIESYEHTDKQRMNNPPVGLVTPGTDPETGAKKTYDYDPHLDPQLQWAGKAEHTSFEVPTVSLHVHERIDPRTIIEAVRRAPESAKPVQVALFQTQEENPPLREAVEFYKHAHGWSNRFIAGDSLLVMNSLLEKEGMAGTVQMSFIDPPYGIKYGSNFQPFVNKREVKDGKDEDLTSEPEQIRAFRDTWELGIHSYLAYLRDRLLLDRELLTESGSVFVQISDENVHHVRELMDEVFGAENFCAEIIFRKTGGQSSNFVPRVNDFVLLYAKNKLKLKFRGLFRDKIGVDNRPSIYRWIESPDSKIRRKMTADELNGITGIETGWKIFAPDTLSSEGATASGAFEFEFESKIYRPGPNQHWKTTLEGMAELKRRNRLIAVSTSLYYVRYIDDFPVIHFDNVWTDTSAGGYSDDKVYVVQTNRKVIQRCLLMTTDPGDLVMDITCGSGTTSLVSEQWGRRWITCDTSRVALTLAKQRLMTAVFDYYELAHPREGVGSGFVYKTVPHITLKSLANNEPPDTETLYDQPLVDRKRHRVSGPFTVEAVPAPAVKSVEDILEGQAQPADASIARSGETLRQSEWRDELLRAGIRGKAGQHIRFARIEPLPGCRW
ncbi:MAG: site-specific DNA-methyltransferase, partial [Syntrophales bacterium]